MEINKTLIGGVLAILITLVTLPNLIEVQDSSEYMVIQSVSGELNVFTEPGPHWQGFGKVTLYPRQKQYSFCSTAKGLCENATAPAKKLRFSDGGHADLSGAVIWQMPSDPKSIVAIHKQFQSAEGVQAQAVAKMFDNAIYLTGPMMSSTESSGSRRAELVQLINDQAENGVYVTHGETVVGKDPVTGEQKNDIVTKIVTGPNGQPVRQQGSILAEYNIKLQPMSISELKYDDIVEKQIKQRQEATTAVQIAQANAKKAEQDAITIAKQGEAKAAAAKWEQETIKAKLVTEAQQKLEVATLAAKEAEQYKNAEILKGQGEAERKKLVMAADGALDKKLEAIVQINANYATAIKEAKPGAWVPVVQMSGKEGGGGNGATALVDLLTARAARDTGVDLSVAGAGKTK